MPHASYTATTVFYGCYTSLHPHMLLACLPCRNAPHYSRYTHIPSLEGRAGFWDTVKGPTKPQRQEMTERRQQSLMNTSDSCFAKLQELDIGTVMDALRQ